MIVLRVVFGSGSILHYFLSSLLIAATFKVRDSKALTQVRPLREMYEENTIYKDSYSSSLMEDCNLSSIPIVKDFHMNKFSGTWYEFAKTKSGYIDLRDGKWNIFWNKTTARFIYSGRNREDDCVHPLSGTTTISENNDGELTLHYQTQSTLVTERVTVLHTDYDSIAIIYNCVETLEDGSCHPAGVFASIWTRLPHVDEVVYEQAVSVLEKHACLDRNTLTVTSRVGPCEEFNSVRVVPEDTGPDQFPNKPFCHDVSRCAVHCPPCCYRLHSCVVCDCRNIILENFQKCYSMDECPIDCLFEEQYNGCHACVCDQEKKFKTPGACLEVIEHGNCNMHCQEICQENDMKKLKRYYHEAFSGKCLPFDYTGCGGNKNNFHSEEDCQKICLGMHTDGNDDGDNVDVHILLIIAAHLTALFIYCLIP